MRRIKPRAFPADPGLKAGVDMELSRHLVLVRDTDQTLGECGNESTAQ